MSWDGRGMLEDAWDMVVHSDMKEMETFRCEILIREQFLSDLANWSQSSRLYNRSPSKMPIMCINESSFKMSIDKP